MGIVSRRWAVLVLAVLSASASISFASITPIVQDFGSLAVGTSATATLTFQLSSIAQPVSVRLQFGTHFLAALPVCTAGSSPTCSLSVTFLPQSPGLQQDTLRIVDSSATLVAVAKVQGMGLGAQPEIYPGIITTFAGNRGFGSLGDGGPPAQASFSNPERLAVDPQGAVYVSDSVASVVRKINGNVISTIVGDGTHGFRGDGSAPLSAELESPMGLAIDAAGNLYIADRDNNRIRKVDVFGNVISTIAGNGRAGAASASWGDGALATAANLSAPTDVALDTAGNLYIADTGHNRIRKVDTSGLITTVAGGGTPVPPADGIGNGGPALNAQLNGPSGVAVDFSGNIYIADTGDNLIRIVRSGIISVLAGTGDPNYGGDGGPATTAKLAAPTALALDVAQQVYIADTGNSVVRQIDALGIVHTLAGEAGQFGFSGDGGSAVGAVLDAPASVAADEQGKLYVVDAGNREVRVVSSFAGTLTLGSTRIGQIGTSQAVTLANLGNQSLTVSALTLSAQFLQQSSGSSDCAPSLTIGPGSNCSISVASAPTAAGTLTGTLSVNTLSGSHTFPSQTVSLTATGTGSVGAVPTLNATGATFGTQKVGVVSPAKAITLQNNAASSVTLQSVSFSGSNPNDFSGNFSSCSAAIASGSTCPVSVTFLPTATGSRSASVTLTESSVTTTYVQTILLTGTGVDLQPSATPTTLDFGTQALNVASTRETVTLSNPGALPLNLLGATVSGGTDFAITDSTCGGTLASGATCTVGLSYTPTASGIETATLSFLDSDASSPQIVPITGSGAVPLRFVPITPCRVADTRNATGSLGGPEIAGNTSRDFPVQSSGCGIPSSAAAYSMNITAVPDGLLGYMTVWATGQVRPLTSVLNSDGRVKANAAIVPAGSNGSVSVYVTHPSHVILDVDGYFVPASTASSLAFYPIAPCRVLDTRTSTGSLGGPSLGAQQTRSLPILSSPCQIPSTASAYSLNFTVLPKGFFGYLSTWPTGSSQPLVSTLNAYTGTVTANAAIVPAGTNGAISVFVTHPTDLVVDINGYFAPAGSGGLSLYTVPQCRVYDSRTPPGTGTLTGVLRVNFEDSTCGLPSTAQAYVTNATVVPTGSFGYLTLWPDGQTQPLVSTLNAYDGVFASNLAIVPTTNGNIDAYLRDQGSLILDVSAYFAP